MELESLLLVEKRRKNKPSLCRKKIARVAGSCRVGSSFSVYTFTIRLKSLEQGVLLCLFYAYKSHGIIRTSSLGVNR